MARKAGVAAVAWSLLGSAAVAQNRPLAPDGMRLVPGVDSLAVYLIKGTDTTRTGTIVDELIRMEDGLGAQLLRVYRSEDAVLGSRLDTIVDALPSLRPRAHYSLSSQLLHRLDFDSTSVGGWVRLVNGDSAGVDVPLMTEVYNGASLDLVLRASHLELGQHFSVPAFISSTRTVVPLTGRVARADSVGGSRCWVVVTDFGGVPVTFWIDENTRQLRQQLMQLRVDTAILFKEPDVPHARKRAT